MRLPIHTELSAVPPAKETMMAELTKNQRDYLQNLLREREHAVRAHLKQKSDARDDYVQVASEAPDPGDSSFATLSIDLGNAAVGRDVGELRSIEAARLRMQCGDYGECTQCGYDIPYERLVAQPTAARCAPCQNNFERTHADAGKSSSM